jgi:hypothetical protein
VLKNKAHLVAILKREWGYFRQRSFILISEKGDWEFRYNNYRPIQFKSFLCVYCVELFQDHKTHLFSSDCLEKNLKKIETALTLRQLKSLFSFGLGSHDEISKKLKQAR